MLWSLFVHPFFLYHSGPTVSSSLRRLLVQPEAISPCHSEGSVSDRRISLLYFLCHSALFLGMYYAKSCFRVSLCLFLYHSGPTVSSSLRRFRRNLWQSHLLHFLCHSGLGPESHLCPSNPLKIAKKRLMNTAFVAYRLRPPLKAL